MDVAFEEEEEACGECGEAEEDAPEDDGAEARSSTPEEENRETLG